MTAVVGVPCRSGALPGREAGFVGAIESYIGAVHSAGGSVVLLPTQAPELSRDAVERCDALLLAGGEDLSQSTFWSVGEPKGTLDPSRDQNEITLLLAALEFRKPVLGICRGMQLINCALGGTLGAVSRAATLEHDVQHLRPDGGSASHAVLVKGGRLLPSVFGDQTSIAVLSRHNACIAKVAPGVEIAACSADGVVEAIEVRGDARCIGVQWHAEVEAAAGKQPGLALFQWLVCADHI